MKRGRFRLGEARVTAEELLKRVADTLDRWDDYGLLLLRKRILNHLERREELMTDETREGMSTNPGMTEERLQEIATYLREHAKDGLTRAYGLEAIKEIAHLRAENAAMKKRLNAIDTARSALIGHLSCDCGHSIHVHDPDGCSECMCEEGHTP